MTFKKKLNDIVDFEASLEDGFSEIIEISRRGVSFLIALIRKSVIVLLKKRLMTGFFQKKNSFHIIE